LKLEKRKLKSRRRKVGGFLVCFILWSWPDQAVVIEYLFPPAEIERMECQPLLSPALPVSICRGFSPREAPADIAKDCCSASA